MVFLRFSPQNWVSNIFLNNIKHILLQKMKNRNTLFNLHDIWPKLLRNAHNFWVVPVPSLYFTPIFAQILAPYSYINMGARICGKGSWYIGFFTVYFRRSFCILRLKNENFSFYLETISGQECFYIRSLFQNQNTRQEFKKIKMNSLMNSNATNNTSCYFFARDRILRV